MAKFDADCKWMNTLVNKLCIKLTGTRNDERASSNYKKAIEILTRVPPTCPAMTDRLTVPERIKRTLAREGNVQSAVRFTELYRKLQSQSVLRNNHAILWFLFLMQNAEKDSKIVPEFNSLPPAFSTSTPQQPIETPRHIMVSLNASSVPRRADITTRTLDTIDSTVVSNHQQISGSSSGVSSGLSRVQNMGQRSTLNSRSNDMSHYSTHQTSNEVRFGTTPQQLSSGDSTTVVPVNVPSESMYSNRELNPKILLQHVLYVIQGVESDVIKFDPASESYYIECEDEVHPSLSSLCVKLSELGWFHKKIDSYIRQRRTDKAFGFVGQSFCVVLGEELTEYYRLIAVIDSQLKHSAETTPPLTFHQLATWLFGPTRCLKLLAALVDVCQGKKGGSLASVVHSYLRHGNPKTQRLVRHILTRIADPIYTTILNWIYDGEMQDPFLEFFVASDPSVRDDRLWNDRYRLRKSMIPSFVTKEQASRILMVGKSLNFLHKVCHDRTPVDPQSTRDKLSHASGVDSMISQDENGIFQNMIESTYSVTSARLLSVLNVKYKFMDHLKALRRYLLLGQGDFIWCLMDLLQSDLAKPAGVVYLHNLTGYLDIAIRTTNAQFDHADILKRLDVRLLEVSPGDTGWDVFSLYYHVDGPLTTVFTNECIVAYLKVFNFLWRAKRMEYVLNFVWKQQRKLSREIGVFPALSGLLHHCHIIASNMYQFVQQFQYYINFEVLECAWDELFTKVSKAIDLDHIIAAHQVFLDSVMSRCLLDEPSQGILMQLRTIFDLTINFQHAQQHFSQALATEATKQRQFEAMKEKRTEMGEWALVRDEEEVEMARRKEFLASTLSSTRPELTVLANSYQHKVNEFLQVLSHHEDTNLRCLCFRLDFNQYYQYKKPNRMSVRSSLSRYN